jgi:hypothetical protein
MKKPIALAALAVVMLAGCSEPAQSPPSAGAVAPLAAPEPQATTPSPMPADYPAKLLRSIDTAPQCQPFRAQIEEAGKAASEGTQPVDMNQLNEIAAKAYQAGCYRRP